ncbi:response regulator [Rhodomicrobium sp. Az07]|uniref:response regulator n=1 Tax=Rhodomicrobium sp. Az07 TaxID=2839034 RepID=UPI001BEA439A|nr:response regulator [Rhodomicrobium sp. Az07]MBT3072106.1 response regulator [Rhodomicrobium sp. Az07]
MANKNPRILIIDDDEGFCRLVANRLERSGFSVVSAYSAAAGLEEISASEFDVVLLDHVLPEQDGLSLIASLQSRSNAPPIVYLTGTQDSRVAVAALKAGAADYVVKDLHGDFLLVLENAITNAMFTTALKRERERAEAAVRNARDEFKALAEERALLLREVNHRVSNSLQLIASLLHFQGDVSGNADVKAALKEANGRVLAVARVHRALYTSFDVRWVTLSDYLASLIRDLEDVSGGEGTNGVISFSGAPIQISPDAAVSVGIVTTELILNALKHAYPNGHGQVRVIIRLRETEIDLVVEDDGVGTRDDPPEKTRRRGLGQRIIAGMAEKLEGALRYEKLSPGTRAVLTFPLGEHVRVLQSEAALS